MIDMDFLFTAGTIGLAAVMLVVIIVAGLAIFRKS